MKIYIKYLGLLALAITSCEPELDNSIKDQGVYTSGDADFSNFVAVGNSLTAGYADGALYVTGQENSYPNILAQQFSFAGGGDFKQPLVNDNLGGLVLGGQPVTANRYVLSVGANGPAPARLAGTSTTDVSVKLEGSYNNMGVPGAKSFHLLAPGYGNVAGVTTGASNPYFARFASSADATVIGDAIAQDPSFFALWIGNNDILSYATSGGVGVDQKGNFDPATYGGNDITDPNVFAAAYSEMVTALSAGASGGVLINIPDVTSIPYFTTVPYNAIPLDAQTAAFVNQSYTDYNNAIATYAFLGYISAEEAAARTITFQAGQNAVVITDEDLTVLPNPAGGSLPNLRQASAQDLVVLPASSIIGTLADPSNPASVMGVGVPLGDALVLTTEEQVLVKTAQTAYNATIRALAQATGLAFVDAQKALETVATSGISYDAGMLTSAFVTGGAFSLDGVHPTPRGYAYVANLVIKAVNNQYNSTVPVVNIGNYNTVTISNDVN